MNGQQELTTPEFSSSLDAIISFSKQKGALQQNIQLLLQKLVNGEDYRPSALVNNKTVNDYDN